MTAAITLPSPTPRWGVVELEIAGPSTGNPFLDVELHAVFRLGEDVRRVGGFYDGDGVYRVRLLAEKVGTWTFVVESNEATMDGLAGEIEVIEAGDSSHGPVRVDGMHFRHADGTRYRPWGTTAYAWTHQPEDLQEKTLATLAAAPFTKLRMCIFPKSYLFTMNEPERLPFVRSDSGFDPTRFDTEFFATLDRRIRQLGDLGIEADLILFHSYDRWGFADLGAETDERYVRYVTRRLAAFSNVWWSLANEYDLMGREVGEWERIAETLGEEDPHGHLTSIHNGLTFYDHSRPWVTHCSIQRVDLYRTSENTDAWRQEWAKPIVIDECGYEGDIDQAWGNISGEELMRRTWEGAVRGGYVGHGETYVNDREELWWSKGGDLIGGSPARFAFLDSIIEASPTGVLEPVASDWDAPWGGVAGEYLVGYLGMMQPRFRGVSLPEGRFHIDVIDTWNMTVERLPELASGSIRVELPGRPYMAIRAVLHHERQS